MHRKTWEEMSDCADCGQPLDAALERGYMTEGEWALCWTCATARGAQFDENEDCWTVPPNLEGLPIDRQHRVR